MHEFSRHQNDQVPTDDEDRHEDNTVRFKLTLHTLNHSLNGDESASSSG
jgi:hypothetical protein